MFLDQNTLFLHACSGFFGPLQPFASVRLRIDLFDGHHAIGSSLAIQNSPVLALGLLE